MAINNEPSIKPITVTGIFTRYIAKTIPLAFDESMSYYECLCALLEYINTKVVPALDTNAEALSELQEFYKELQSYVNNYFDNLDIQTEINRKLDEMAESGQLTDIIAQYLGLAGMITFDTVEDMKAAENLVNGSKCRTLGFHSYNDGGGAFYKIRTITNDDVVDEMTIIEVYDDTLIAELLIENKMNVKQFGAVSDGTTNSSTAINKCFSIALPYSEIDCSGDYAINETIILPIADNVTVKNGKFKSLSANGYLTLANDPSDLRTYYTGYYLTIDNIYVDGDYKANGLYLTKALGVIIKNSVFRNFLEYGIKIGDYESHDNIIDTCQFIGRSSSHEAVESTCLIVEKPDNQISNCVFSYAQWAVKMMTATNMITNCHFYCNDTETGGNLYISGGLKLVDHCYFDGSGIFFNGSTNIIVDNSIFLVSDRCRGSVFNFHHNGNAAINGIQIKNCIISDYRSDTSVDKDIFSLDYNVTAAVGNICDFRTLPSHLILNNPANIFTWGDSKEVCFSTLEPIELANINAQTNVISSHSTTGIDTYYDKVNVSSKMVETNYIGSESTYRWVLIPFYVSGKATVKITNATSGNIEGRLYNSNYELISGKGVMSTLTAGKYFFAAFRTNKYIINK